MFAAFGTSGTAAVAYFDKQCSRSPEVERDAEAGTGAGAGLFQFSEPSDAFQVGFADYVAIGRPAEETASKHSAEDDFSDAERAFFMTLTTPGAIQQYLDSVPMNHEVQDDTCLSALESVRQNQAHCIEGAMLGAYILSLHGHPPYVCNTASPRTRAGCMHAPGAAPHILSLSPPGSTTTTTRL